MNCLHANVSRMLSTVIRFYTADHIMVSLSINPLTLSYLSNIKDALSVRVRATFRVQYLING